MAVAEVGKLVYPWCQKVLPLVYDDSLSYYENICQFVNKLNEMADVINSIELDILGKANAYTDSKIAESLVEVDVRIAEIRQLVDSTKAEFEAILAETQDKYDRFERNVTNQILIFNQALVDIRREIENDIIGVNARTDLAIQQNNEYILEQVGKGLVTLKVLNYFTGEYVTVQEMFDYLANFHLSNAATYAQILAKDFTYNEMIAKNEDYTNWATRGYDIINA